MFGGNSNNNNNNNANALNTVESNTEIPSDEIPQSFLCPLTLELMNEPVIDREGNTYEKAAIMDWLQKGNTTSPLTRSALKADDLTPNRSIKEAITEFKLHKAEEARKYAEKEDSATNYVMLKGNGSNESVNIQLALQDAASVDGVSSNNDLFCLATIKASMQEEKRPPIDLCCVIDVSGSMGSTATIKNANGATESNGLTVLDIVKHGVKTMMEVLTSDDSLSIVAYSTEARVVCPLLKMDSDGKRKIYAGLENMVPTNSTNIWDGLHKGMEVLRTRNATTNPGFVMLLTDGLPNVVPPRGHIPMLKQYLDANPDFDVTINTYGFGYNLDSSLMNDIATTTKGMYSFIPDPGFVGTVFVNSISNVLSTSATDVSLALEDVDSSPYEIEQVYGDQTQMKKASWGVHLNIGKLQYGQDRSFLMRLKLKKNRQVPLKQSNNANGTNMNFISATLNFTPVQEDKKMVLRTDENVYGNQKSAISNQLYRLSIYDTVTAAISILSPPGNVDRYGTVKANYNAEKYTNEVEPLIARLTELAKSMKRFNNTDYLAGMEQDVSGQIVMGLSTKAAFVKWGKHFLLSLMRAHSLQQCLNFKDPGVQFYGGTLFNQLRDLADDKFNKLPPPKPRPGYKGRAVASMSSYNNRYAGCFDGEGKVTLADGVSTKLVKDLRKGDEVLTRNGVVAKIVCMIRTEMKNSQCEMVQLQNGVKLTPWHPVYVNNEWKFPNDIGKLILYDGIDYIYNAVVDKGHSLMINGLHCVTLGHHLKENKVVEHPYFGTDLVLESLKDVDANGWEQGYINMKEGVHKTLRDQETGLIVGMTTSNPKSNMAQSFVSSVFDKATTNVGTKYNVGFMESKEEQKQECYA